MVCDGILSYYLLFLLNIYLINIIKIRFKLKFEISYIVLDFKLFLVILVLVYILLIYCRCLFFKLWSWGIIWNICIKKFDKLGFCIIYYWLFFFDV